MKKKAVALNYEKNKDLAPKVKAKGEGLIAEKIIQIAHQNNIPIKEDKELIQILSSIPLDQEIPPELYKAVAEIFAYIYSISKKKID
ncbi:MAG: type III secretion system protein [Aquificae bacterium]|nr:type III secretion system protein [Aquificota bacterium]